jgi:hypothetical protein
MVVMTADHAGEQGEQQEQIKGRKHALRRCFAPFGLGSGYEHLGHMVLSRLTRTLMVSTLAATRQRPGRTRLPGTVHQANQRFAGYTLTSARQARALLAKTALRIFPPRP